jgi:hypothetical protein
MRIDAVIQPVRRVARPIDLDLLPSERSVRELRHLVDASGGEIDRHALLRQLRPGPAPRWFLYDPVRPCDEVLWSASPEIAFEMCCGSGVSTRILTRTPSSWRGSASFRAAPLLLPSALRERVRDLAARRIQCYVLYEPARVIDASGRPFRLGDRSGELALAVELDDAWYLLESASGVGL